MDDPFYSRASGKLKKTSHFSFTSGSSKKRDQSSVYSLEDNDEDYSQLPMGTLTKTQIKYLTSFMRSICGTNEIEIDEHSRAIHLVKSWIIPETETTVVCTLLQPHITNTTIGLQGMTYADAVQCSRNHFSQDESRSPSFIKTLKYCQVMGRYSTAFIDTILDKGIVSNQQVSWNNVLMSQTQPIFSVCNKNMLYECRLTHASCGIIADNIPAGSTATAPTSEGHNYSFRSSDVRSGTGTGPSITVHSSGIIQYQGKPQSIEIVASSFRNCILSVMESSVSMRFVRSLSVIRKIPIP